MIIGSVFGQLLRIDLIINDVSDSLKLLIGNTESSFTQGLITAFLLFCVGSMTIIGALEEGIHQKRELLYVKSTLDGFSSIALASTYGIGVLFSIIPMLIFQGGITVLALRLKYVFNQNVMDALSHFLWRACIFIAHDLLCASFRHSLAPLTFFAAASS